MYRQRGEYRLKVYDAFQWSEKRKTRVCRQAQMAAYGMDWQLISDKLASTHEGGNCESAKKINVNFKLLSYLTPVTGVFEAMIPWRFFVKKAGQDSSGEKGIQSLNELVRRFPVRGGQSEMHQLKSSLCWVSVHHIFKRCSFLSVYLAHCHHFMSQAGQHPFLWAWWKHCAKLCTSAQNVSRKIISLGCCFQLVTRLCWLLFLYHIRPVLLVFAGLSCLAFTLSVISSLSTGQLLPVASFWHPHSALTS